MDRKETGIQTCPWFRTQTRNTQYEPRTLNRIMRFGMRIKCIMYPPAYQPPTQLNTNEHKIFTTRFILDPLSSILVHLSPRRRKRLENERVIPGLLGNAAGGVAIPAFRWLAGVTVARPK